MAIAGTLRKLMQISMVALLILSVLPASLDNLSRVEAQAPTGEELYLVTWKATEITRGAWTVEEDIGYSVYTEHKEAEVLGSALLHLVPTGHKNQVTPYYTGVIVRLEYSSFETFQWINPPVCRQYGHVGLSRDTRITRVGDPVRAFARLEWTSGAYYLGPKQEEDGSWRWDPYVFLPLVQIDTEVPVKFVHNYTENAYNYESGQCEVDRSTLSIDENRDLFPFGQPGFGELTGDSGGTSFSYAGSHHEDVERVDVEPGELTIDSEVEITARSLCGSALLAAKADASLTPEAAAALCRCGQQPAPDINDPEVQDVDLRLTAGTFTTIPPDGRVRIVAEVTCGDKPIPNAGLEATVIVLPKSGGHQHGDAERPPGSLNGFEISQERLGIALTTDANGTAEIIFTPGRDLRDHTRGIAGVYSVTVRLQASRFKHKESFAIITVALPLKRLPGDELYIISPSLSNEHLPVDYATEATAQSIRQIALEFQSIQLEHNEDLQFYHKPTWTVIKPIVVAISTRNGGLFDLGGGGWWRAPFDTHLRGTDVLFELDTETAEFPGSDRRQSLLWLEGKLREIGARYGAWYTDAGVDIPWNLALGNASQPGRSAGLSQGSPDLWATVGFTPTRQATLVYPGQRITYTVGVQNETRQTEAHDVVLTANLPAGISFVAAQPAQTTLDAPGEVRWDVGTLPAEPYLRLFQIVGEVDANITPGAVLTVTAAVTASEVDPTPQNNQAQTFGVLVRPAGPDLAVSADLDATISVEQPVTFTVGVANTGNAAAPGSVLQLTLPASATVHSVSPTPTTQEANSLSWSLGEVAPAIEQSFVLTIQLDSRLLLLLPDGSPFDPPLILPLGVNATTSGVDPDLSNNTIETGMRVEPIGSDLLVHLDAEGAAAELNVGEEFTYTVFYGNFGNQPAPTSTLTVSLRSGVSLLAADLPPQRMQEDAESGWKQLGWDLGELTVGQDGWLHLAVRLDNLPPEGTGALAFLTTGGLDFAPWNNFAQLLVDGTASAGAADVRMQLPLILAR